MQFLKSSTQEEKEITALNKYKLFQSAVELL